jgi:trans-2-enoyl-CoA reductase
MSTSVLFNLASRYQAAFGIHAKAKLVEFASINTKQVETQNLYEIDYYGKYDDQADRVIFDFNSQRFVFSDMLLGDNSGIFAPPLILNFSREKQHIETTPSGSDNLVVERWSTTPWTIDIRGVLIDVENKQYPKEKIQQLVSLFNFNDTIKVIGEQFYDKDIDSIYTKALNITPVEGYQDTIQFTISARSIKAVNFTLLKPI